MIRGKIIFSCSKFLSGTLDKIKCYNWLKVFKMSLVAITDDVVSAYLAVILLLGGMCLRQGNCNNILSFPSNSDNSVGKSFPKRPLAKDLSNVAILLVRISDNFFNPFDGFGLSKTSVVSCQPICVVIKQTSGQGLIQQEL